MGPLNIAKILFSLLFLYKLEKTKNIKLLVYTSHVFGKRMEELKNLIFQVNLTLRISIRECSIETVKSWYWNPKAEF